MAQGFMWVKDPDLRKWFIISVVGFHLSQDQ
ncbi:Uncharacterised protein [Mycobacteroides abscessus subsp. massiliense]|nr:Uncharacterised protein [Mycobacteroides abscessus subsp. massiliense]SLI31112.1 Uncharacterised protein [Mycobacteroides abscessus subsp. massiliense]